MMPEGLSKISVSWCFSSFLLKIPRNVASHNGKDRRDVAYATLAQNVSIIYIQVMIKTKEDPRITRTKEAIRETLKTLVCELPYEKITIKALTDRARINRNTFYLHYESIDEVLMEIQSEYSSKYIEIVKGLNYMENISELVSAFFNYLESQDEFFRVVTCNPRYDFIRMGMQRKVTKSNRNRTLLHNESLRKYGEYAMNIIQVHSNSILYFYRQWVADGRKIPMKEMIALASTLLQNGIEGIKK